MQTTYEIKLFKNSRASDLAKALVLYSQNINPALRTDTREILYWIDKYNQQYDDSFFVLGFYQNNKLIGFTELAYFKHDKFVIVDYIVIDKPYRKNNAFYEFLEKIREFLLEQEINFDFLVVEIGFFHEKEPHQSIRHFIRLLKLSSFGVLKCNYYLPRLGSTNLESDMKGIMMIYTSSETSKIKKSTFLNISKAIYFKYYQRWYDVFLDADSKIKYNKILIESFSKMEKELKDKNYIEINGFNDSFNSGVETDYTKLHSKKRKLITGIILFLFWTILIGFVYIFVNKTFGFDANTLSAIFYAALLISLFFLSLFFDKKLKMLSKIINKLFDK